MITSYRRIMTMGYPNRNSLTFGYGQYQPAIKIYMTVNTHKRTVLFYHFTQGFWIIEIAELAGFRKAEVETTEAVIETTETTTVETTETEAVETTEVETTDLNGEFNIRNIQAGNYFLKATFVGLPDLTIPDLQLESNETKNLDVLAFESQVLQLRPGK